ncbi:MAG: hypothetical protein ACJ76V_13730, partial [Thermoleophilaceae bacterium]
AGVEVTASLDAGPPPDLVVAPARLARAAMASGAAGVIVHGADASAVARAHGMSGRRLLALPRLHDPVAFLALGEPDLARYALQEMLVPTRRWKEVRNLALVPVLSRGLVPSRTQVTVASRSKGDPFLVDAARHLGTPERATWLLSPGQGDVLARGAFHLFPEGSDHPSHVLKFSRMPGRSEPFERDQHGLAVAEAGGPTVAPHAPRLLGRIEEARVHASVETAARGRHMTGFLVSDRPAAERLAAVEEIADWLVRVAVETAAGPSALAPEIERLGRDVVSAWKHEGATPALLDGLDQIPAVLQHNDLGSWNLVIKPGGFTAVDWESARLHGLPLWDLWYFMADVLGHMDRVTGPEQRERHFLQLFRGELPASRLLFEWTRTAAEASGVPREAIGRIATLCWLHHGLSPLNRLSELHSFQPGAIPPYWLKLTRRIAVRWLRDPALGPEWQALPR